MGRAADRNSARIHVTANRAVRKWSRKEIAGRMLWDLLHPFFAFSPRPMWAWRRGLLRPFFGARIGRHVHIYPTARISVPWSLSIADESAIGDRAIVYALGPISVGKRATISQGVHLCAGTHDYRDPTMPLLKPPIAIGDDSWICADAFLGPGIEKSAPRAIVAARAVVIRDVEAGAVVGGDTRPFH